MNQIIYINGVKHHCTGLNTVFFADSPGLPGRWCSQHTLKEASIHWLKNGGGVFTSGNHYSLQPSKERE